MSTNPEAEGADGNRRTALSIIRDIRSGQLDPKEVATEERISVVGHLTAEGFSVPEIADVLKVSERTVRRDKESLRSAHALVHRKEFAGEMAGQLQKEAETSVFQIRRAMRDKDASPTDRINGAMNSWVIQCRLAEMLQKLGYLPTAPTELRGEIQHHVQNMDASSLVAEFARLNAIVKADPCTPPEQLVQLESIGSEIRKFSVSEQIKSLEASIQEKGEQHGKDEQP